VAGAHLRPIPLHRTDGIMEQIDTIAATKVTTGRPEPIIKVWDNFIRIFHWSLVILFAAAYYSRDKWEQVHIAAGYAILALVATRLIWGVIGTPHARFRDFLYSPRKIVGFLVDTVRFRAKRYLGHNPAGGAMVVALLLVLVAICGSGVMMTLDYFWGVKWIETIHEASAYAALALIALHVAGVVLASIEHRENLIKSMFTGRKRL
jgi:cytochrome b